MTVLYTRLLVLIAAQAFWLSFLFSYFQIAIPLPDLGIQTYVHDALARPVAPATHDSARKKTIVMTPEQLAKYDGRHGSKGLHLAFVGKIYDVSKGKKHYGPGGGYSFFAGKDATRAFVTGDFTEKGLIDEMDGLSHQDVLGLEEWEAFYQKDYTFIGYLEGTYYDSSGRPTAKQRKIKEMVRAAKAWQASERAETEKYPPCNSEWKQNKGGRVWCTKKSGGVQRNWIGVPRRLFKPGSSHSRCACINEELLDSPNLKEYPGCPSNSESCKTSDS